jgi:putative transposase
VVRDNGAEFVNRDFVTVLKAESLRQIRTRVHHHQSNGTVERYHRTFREEGWRQHQPADYPVVQALIARWVEHYNGVRPHSALGYRPRPPRRMGSPRSPCSRALRGR